MSLKGKGGMKSSWKVFAVKLAKPPAKRVPEKSLDPIRLGMEFSLTLELGYHERREIQRGLDQKFQRD